MGSTPGDYDTLNTTDFSVKPGEDSEAKKNSALPTDRSGRKYSINRLLDVDHDGRVDVVAWIPGLLQARVHFNMGGNFVPYRLFPGDYAAVDRESQTTNELDTPHPSKWKLFRDHVDLDGDGIAEGVSWLSETAFQVSRHDVATHGSPRLLKSIDNGRGAETSIVYDSMHSATVSQAPNVYWFDGRPKATTQKQWVVKSITLDDKIADTVSTTTYRYINPRHGADDEGRYSFRGFESVETTSPSGSKTTSKYDYSVDWSGRLVESAVQAANSSFTHTWESTKWEERTLFGGSIKTYHATLTEQATCRASQNRQDCSAGTTPGPAAYSRTTTTLSGIGATVGLPTEPLLWQATGSSLQSSSVADGIRDTVETFGLLADASGYRLRPLTSTKNHQLSGAVAMYAKSASTWDPTYRTRLTSEVWVDASDTNRAITTFEYDMQTGNHGAL